MGKHSRRDDQRQGASEQEADRTICEKKDIDDDQAADHDESAS